MSQLDRITDTNLDEAVRYIGAVVVSMRERSRRLLLRGDADARVMADYLHARESELKHVLDLLDPFWE